MKAGEDMFHGTACPSEAKAGSHWHQPFQECVNKTDSLDTAQLCVLAQVTVMQIINVH